MKEMVGGCCVCSDERGWPDNPLVYCDGNGCTVAVHQACYGIVTVPTGPWFCRKCESPETKGKVRCELCPSKSGALKRTDTGGWAHVVCALYIPEVRFGNVTSMEPIVLRLIPTERYSKSCYICQESGKSHRATAGACMQCNKSGCKQQFHVTCAQSLGLLCEEAGNYLDNVKYCGYCQHHYSKLKKGGNVKTIPPYKPVSHDSQSSDSSGEKEGSGSPMQTGGATPTHANKSKGPGRKNSHAASAVSGKNTPNPSKTPTSTSQAVGSKVHHTSERKKASPARRGSSTGETGGSGSKSNTPAPSPLHNSDSQGQTNKGGSTPGGSNKVALPSASPSSKVIEATVISAIPLPPLPATPVSTVVTTSVVQSPAKPPIFQESVINNPDTETKLTKKRKAISGVNNTTEFVPQPPLPPEAPVVSNPWESVLPPSSHPWEGAVLPTDLEVEPTDKIVKKAKTDTVEGNPIQHQPSPAPVVPSPPTLPSPRHLPSPMPPMPPLPPMPPMPGPSGVNPAAANLRSPSQPQVPVPADMSTHSPHIFHQPQKQAAVEASVSGHSPHAVPGRTTWGGLNVSYEMQQDLSKPGVSGVAGPSKDMNSNMSMNQPIRNKKRAAMAALSGADGSSPHTSGVPNLANVRRPPQPTPPPIYHEAIKDSPPSSPSSDRPLRPKLESNRLSASTAPHMLGNELNPESGACARLQEQLSAELAAHAAGTARGHNSVPPPLINKAGSSGGRSSSAQSLDQLLERQWEQGSQFLMEQAQHFDIASLLSCLHQLRTENVRLEEHVGSLLQRRDHLLAVNARLAIPLTTVPAGPPEPSRGPRENGSQVRAPPTPLRPAETITSERSHQQLMYHAARDKPS